MLNVAVVVGGNSTAVAGDPAGGLAGANLAIVGGIGAGAKAFNGILNLAVAFADNVQATAGPGNLHVSIRPFMDILPGA